MDDDQQYCLRWNNHQSTLISVFDTLLENETLVDCTLAAEGKILKAHKVVLSACSPYFATLLQEQYDKHPVFILKDVKYQELRAMMDYMYRGEVNISQDQLAALLKAAESLQIKGLSDNRAGSSAAAAAPKPEQHLRGKMGTGYTLEQTKRARMATGAMDAQDVSGSREGSSSPSRRRRKVRRRSMENDAHDNSNSSVMQAAASNQLILQQSNAASALVATQMPIAAGVSIAPGSAHTSATGVAGATQGTTQQQVQPLTTTSVNKKTDSAKGITTSISTAAAAAQQSAVQTSEVINTENVQVASGSSQCGAVIVGVEEQDVKSSGDKANHKQKLSKEATTSAGGSEMVIEPKAEYDDEGHEETVEDLTLDDEEIGMEELDQTAGTSQGGEGSSQGYAAWQHDRSQEELLLATQEAQQRDPQDFSQKEYSTLLGGNIKRINPCSIFNKRDEPKVSNLASRRKRLSVTEVSDMLFEYYKSKSAKVPKQQEQQEKALAEINKFAQISPTSAETNEPSTIAAIATNCASVTASKNLQADEMMPLQSEAANNASFHPRLKYSLKQTNDTADEGKHDNSVVMTSIPTSVLVPNAGDATSQDQHQLLQLDIKPTINQIPGLAMTPISAPANVKPQAAAIAEALLRNGYHSFQQQLRAQEILRQRSPRPLSAGANSASGGSIGSVFGGNGDLIPSKILENLLRKQQAQEQRHSECENEPETGSEDEDDSRMNSFDDIHLIENAVPKFGNNSLPRFPANNGGSVPTQDAQALAFRNLEYTLSDYGGSSNGSSTSPNGLGPDGEPTYECRHCGKRYRWKSTLRRHENVECGGKEPAHQCPYCPYKSKQRGNLGVHVRKHHTDLPQLPSKRRSKYSLRMEEMSMNSSGASNDDSKSKLVVNNTNWQSTSGNLSN